MADITKRVRKKMAKHLDPGEEVGLALLLEPRGQYGIGMIQSVLAPRSTRRAQERRDSSEREATPGIAANLPTGSMAMVVTNGRMLMSPSNGLRFAEPVFAVDRQAVRVGAIESKGLGKRITLVFQDGSAAVFDAQRGQPFDELSQTLGTTTPPPT